MFLKKKIRSEVQGPKQNGVFVSSGPWSKKNLDTVTNIASQGIIKHQMLLVFRKKGSVIFVPLELTEILKNLCKSYNIKYNLWLFRY